MRMFAANNKGINILEATILRFSGQSKSGETLKTRQITYVTSDSERLFLSREACIALRMISDTFPTVGEASPLTTLHTPGNATPDSTDSKTTSTPQRSITAPGDYLLCQNPPPRPTQSPSPSPATEVNRALLQQWLLDYYASSTFNTCEHQLLPLMHGPRCISGPLHWQADVKADLDRDVALGVLEPVPVGEPVTWCHKMIICAKRKGQPRRTVNLQALNLHATRKTHHTQSPFHQARSVPHNMKKTIFDCWNGYHSVAIHPDDRHYT